MNDPDETAAWTVGSAHAVKFGRKRDGGAIAGDPTELANGTEPDGIKYIVRMDGSGYRATVTAPDGRMLTEFWRWQQAPKCGLDVADINTANEVMERLIRKLRAGHEGR